MKMETIGHVQAFILERMKESTSNNTIFQEYNNYFKFISHHEPSLKYFKRYLAGCVRCFENNNFYLSKERARLCFNVAKDIFINCFGDSNV